MTRIDFERPLVIGAIAVIIVLVYVCRLAYLQLGDSEDAVAKADANAFFHKTIFPSRGLIYDRNGKPMVYNHEAYDVMVIMREMENLDTLDFCKTMGITKRQFDNRMARIKDLKKNPAYSSYSQQLFMAQIPVEKYSRLQEKLFLYKGFFLRSRTVRSYAGGGAAHVLGDVAEVSYEDVKNDDYYTAGDFIGKQGVERSYERVLRGKKGVQIMLRDARGKIQGHYRNGELDEKPSPGKDITLGLDYELQELGEKLMAGRTGSIVAIEPNTGEILCSVSAPGYDLRDMTIQNRGEKIMKMIRDPRRPMLNRAVSGTYPPGSTFKPAQALTLMQERVINLGTYYPCAGGFHYKGMKVGCHPHETPINMINALATSCNGFFCWGLYHMLHDKYGDKHKAMNRWRDYMVSMGFGYKLGVDLPAEARGMIPNAEYYDKFFPYWNPLSVVSISIGQGEVTLTPLQIANLGATIANRGYYITPHVVKAIDGEEIADSLRKRHYTMVEPTYYDYVRKGMRAAVVSGTCKEALSSPYMICGKTGTAQNRGVDHSVFVGFAPMSHPKIALAVYVENGGYGAEVAVPIATQMFNQYLAKRSSRGV